MNLAYERVLGHLERLKLKRVSELLDPISEQATKDSLSYLDFLDRLLEAEASSRAERRLLATQLGGNVIAWRAGCAGTCTYGSAGGGGKTCG